MTYIPPGLRWRPSPQPEHNVVLVGGPHNGTRMQLDGATDTLRTPHGDYRRSTTRTPEGLAWFVFHPAE